MHRVQIHALAARHSLDAMTRLLHAAYAPLAAAGMNFTAATQPAHVTARRAAEGQCFVAECEGEIIGTITVCGPYGTGEAPWADAVPWFHDRDTAHFHQFAVAPLWQGKGLGQQLLAACEQWALQRGYRRLALDTAEPAMALRDLYAKLAYAEVGTVQWDGKTYRSVILQKTLDASPLRAHLRLMARYNVWATHALCQGTDALSDADYRRDVGLLCQSIHGTLNHLLTEHQRWFIRFCEDGPPQLARPAGAEDDRGRLRARLVAGARAWLPQIEAWPESRLEGTLEYVGTAGVGAVWLPFAATLLHVFNHGVHHRGQISAALTAMGRPAPVLDMLVMLQQGPAP